MMKFARFSIESLEKTLNRFLNNAEYVLWIKTNKARLL
jgi:hypothetical protein